MPKRLQIFFNAIKDGQQLFKAGLYEAATAVAISAKSGLERLGYSIDDKVEEWDKQFDLFTLKLSYLQNKIQQELADWEQYTGDPSNGKAEIRTRHLIAINFWCRGEFANTVQTAKKYQKYVSTFSQVGKEAYLKQPDSPSVDDLKKFIEEIGKTDQRLSELSELYKRRYAASCERSEWGEEIIDFLTTEINLEWLEHLTGFKEAAPEVLVSKDFLDFIKSQYGDLTITEDMREWLKIVFENSSENKIYVYILPLEAHAIFRKNNPTVREYCEKWLKMKSATVRPNTLEGYRKAMERHIIAPIGDRYIDEITADDLKMLMVPVSKMSKGLYGTVNMLLKCVFYSAIESDVIKDNPAACINPRGGKAKKEKVALTDKQIGTLLDTIKDLPPYLFVMLGLYAGLRREEILGLQWDCVHIDEDIPYISVRRAWRSVKNRPEVTTLLKTPAAKRDIPIPQILADCLKAEKEKSSSDYVISDSNGEPLSDSQFCRLWHYITVRRVKERKIYRYINGEKIHHTISPKLGERCRTDKSIYYTLDFNVTPHLLRHTYITNLIHEGVDPKTVQYLAGHENSKVTMDIYAKVKYNKPWELAAVVNEAFQPSTEYRENPAS